MEEVMEKENYTKMENYFMKENLKITLEMEKERNMIKMVI